VVVIERYADEVAFTAHLEDPENARVNRQLAPLIEGGGTDLTFLLPMSKASC